MAASIAVVPASGSIVSTKTVVRVTVSGADTNDSSTYDADNHPAETPFNYYLLFDAPAGTDDKRSYVFNVNSEGEHEFNNFIFDAAGTWSVQLHNAATDASVGSAASVVVSA